LKGAGLFHFDEHLRTLGKSELAAHRRRNQDPARLFKPRGVGFHGFILAEIRQIYNLAVIAVSAGQVAQ
jgi:hypothetical protein